MTSKKIDWKVVGIALIPALAVSIAVTLLGGMFGLSEPAVDRVTRIMFFPIFFATYHIAKRRRAATPALNTKEVI